MKRYPWLISPLFGILAVATTDAADEWKDLCNGKNLDGWVQRGGNAKFAVEDGCIVGTAVPNTQNSFLCTARDYQDFILEYDFKVDPALNSGVQVRSQCFDKPTEMVWKGARISIPAKRVHGYQIEIDPEPKKDRWFTAGIYDEARRGWLFPGSLGGDPKGFTEQGRKIFKQGDWNHIRVEAVGASLKTTLNGTPCAAITDTMTPAGFIGLQVHAIGKDKAKEGIQVRWRNLRIQEMRAPEAGGGASNTLTPEEKNAGWRLLWDGKTDKGWRSARADEFPKSGWSIKDGELTVAETSGGEAAAGGDIITREKFADFELLVEFKITPGANSGIKIFVDPGLNKGQGSAIGPEFQILDDAKHPDAKLGRNGNRTMGSLYDMIPAPADKLVKPIGEWNQVRILSQGKHVEFWLNGRKTVEFERGSQAWKDTVAISKYKVWPAFGELDEGHILLQDHGNQVSFRNLKIRVPGDI